MHVVIAGGGFGGVKTAIELASDKSFDITLISNESNFLYYPALYGTATGKSHLESSVPLQKILGHYPNITLVQDAVTHVNPERREITGQSGTSYQYDRLVVALGSVTSYFGIKGLQEHTFGIKSEDEVQRFKAHLHAEMTDPHQAEKTYVVVGAGPTGVELSAALVSYLQRIARNHGVSGDKITVDLVEAAPRVLPKMSESMATRVTQHLTKLGVKVMTGQKVEAASADDLTVNGMKIPSKTVVWTSGVANNPFFKANQHCFKLSEHGGRVEVNAFLMACPDVYVIGDNANTPYVGLAQTALHDAVFVARNLRRERHGQAPKAYQAKMPPVVVPVGENWAVFEWGPLKLWGWPAALLRRAADLIGYHDVLPLGQALGIWRAQYKTEEECPMCQTADEKAASA